MGFELREALRRICVEIGWSYAVFWRAIGSPTPKHLVWEDGYWSGRQQLSPCDDSNSHANYLAKFCTQGESIIDELINKTMVPEVHVIGYGMVGQVASTGIYQWILRDVANVREPILSRFAELKNQFMSGIQTIVIIPILPHGAVQFGSTMRVMENNLFVNHVRTSFMQLLCDPRSPFVATQKVLGQNNLQHAPISSATSDYPFRSDCSNIDGSLATRCNHLPLISSASRSLNKTSSSLSMQCHENVSKNDSGKLSTKKIVTSASLPDTESCQPMIHPAGNSLFHLDSMIERGLVDDQIISYRDMIPSVNEISLSTGILPFMEDLLSICGSRTQESASVTMAPVEGMFEEVHPKSTHPKLASLESSNDHGRYISPAACMKEKIQSSCHDALDTDPLCMPQDFNTSNGNQEISTSSHVNSSPINQFRGFLSSGYLKQKNELSLSCDLSSKTRHGFVKELRSGSSSTVGGNLEIESANCCINHKLNVEKGQSQEVEIDSRFINLRNQKASPLDSPGIDLFEVLGLYGSLDRGLAIDQQSSLDVTSCNTQLNLPPIFYSVIDNDSSCTEIFSESNTDQLLDAVISKINPVTKHSLDESTSCKTSSTKVSGSAHHCSSNDRPASSGKKHEEHISPMLTSNSEAAASTSMRSADSIDETERFDETSKVNRKRPRPGETPRPRPKDRQLIMDRVKELREIVPNGAKCSIDALLEKTIKHMIFLQSVAKHADKLRDSGEPKIINKDGEVHLKENFQGGATWAFEVGSQPMTCPIIVEDLNPPRELLVEMLCEERGFFLEIADLIRGLGLTILKGVMEARKDKIWARFAVETNRDVTRMEIFLSLVRSLEPTIGSSPARHSINNSNMPHKIFNPARVPVTGISDPL